MSRPSLFPSAACQRLQISGSVKVSSLLAPTTLSHLSTHTRYADSESTSFTIHHSTSASRRGSSIIVGSAVAEHADSAPIHGLLAKYVEANKGTLLTPEWNGLSVLQRAASRAAAYDIGFVPSKKAAQTKPKFIWLLNADEVDPKSIPSDAFVVYQGHHGDLGAQLADVIVPGSAYTEKATTWVNTEGRAQLGRAAVPPPGAAREDWKVIRAASEVLGTTLPYDDILALRDRMWEISPTLVRYDVTERTSVDTALVGVKQLIAKTAGAKAVFAPLKKPIENLYQTDPISRASVTMAQCTKAFVKGDRYGFSEEQNVAQAAA